MPRQTLVEKLRTFRTTLCGGNTLPHKNSQYPGVIKIPAKVRAEAIEGLQSYADNYGHVWPWRYVDGVSPDSAGQELAICAWNMIIGSDEASLAEAAGILRDGWSPGEPLELITDENR